MCVLHWCVKTVQSLLICVFVAASAVEFILFSVRLFNLCALIKLVAPSMLSKDYLLAVSSFLVNSSKATQWKLHICVFTIDQLYTQAAKRRL